MGQQVKGFKSKKDVIFAVALGVTAVLYFYLVATLSLGMWWIVWTPVYGFAAIWLSLLIGTGKLPDLSSKQLNFKTQIMTVGENLRPARLILMEDRLIVTSEAKLTQSEMNEGFRNAYKQGFRMPISHQVDAVIPYWALDSLLSEDKGNGTGLGLNFHDDEGDGQVRFFTVGSGANKRVQRVIAEIQKKQEHLVRGLNIPPVELIDLSTIKKYLVSQVIHR